MNDDDIVSVTPYEFGEDEEDDLDFKVEFVKSKSHKKFAETFQNRIKGYGEMAPDQLLANPFNFRIHSLKQRSIVEGVLEEVGWITPVIVNVVTQHMVDGHLRAAICLEKGVPSVPVVFVELTPEEEKIALLMFDQTGALAGIDFPKLAEVGEDVEIRNQMVSDFLDELMEKAKIDNLEIPELDLDMQDPDSEVIFTITCTYRDYETFQKTLSKWAQRPTVTIDFETA